MNDESTANSHHAPTLSVERVSLPACALAAHARSNHLLLLYQASEVVVRRVRGSKQETDRFVTGDVGIYPAGEYGPISTLGPVNNIVISLPGQHLNHFAETRLNLARLELLDQFRTQDALISAIGQALLATDQRGTPLELLYAESLTEALCHHLVQYGTRNRPEHLFAGWPQPFTHPLTKCNIIHPCQPMTPAIRPATPADLDTVIPLMSAFYDHFGYDHELAAQQRVVADFLANPHYGALYLIEAEGQPIGYLILAYGFSFEFDGRDAFVDEFFVLEPYRNRGIGRYALEFIQQ